MTTHRLKTIGRFWDAVENGEKTFEVRLNDRGFQKGDTLELIRLLSDGTFDREPAKENFAPIKLKLLTRKVTFVLQGGQFGLEPLWCVMGLAVPNTDPKP